MPKSDEGVTSDRYQVIPRTLVFLRRGERILMIQGAPTKRLWANQYNGIGGHVERGEDVLSAAHREVQEETGLSVKKLRLAGTLVVDASDEIGIMIFILIGESLVGEPVPSGEGELHWVALDALSDLPLVEDLPVLLPRILAMQPGDEPFSARAYYDETDRIQVRFA